MKKVLLATLMMSIFLSCKKGENISNPVQDTGIRGKWTYESTWMRELTAFKDTSYMLSHSDWWGDPNSTVVNFASDNKIYLNDAVAFVYQIKGDSILLSVTGNGVCNSYKITVMTNSNLISNSQRTFR